MVALALMVSCMPSAYTISASEMFGDGTEDIFTDGEVTSETAAEESTPDVSSADQGEQAQQTTLTYENDSVKVTAEALEDGALPQNTTLKADTVNENSSVSYDTVSQKLSTAAVNKGSSLRGFFAYDVYFADGDGNRVEPNGRIRVTFDYKTPAAPELTDAANTNVTVEKLHYNSSTGDTDVNTLQANEDLKVLNINENKQVHTVQFETGNAAVFAVMWDSPETAAASEETNTEATAEDGAELSDEPAAEAEVTETPAENPDADAAEAPAEDAEVTEAPAEEPAEDAEVTEAPAEEPTEDAEVTEAPAEDSTEEEPAADDSQENETSMIEVLADETNLRAEPSEEAEILTTVNAGTQLPLLDKVTAEDETEWYKVSYEESDAYIRSDMAKIVENSDETEEVQEIESEEAVYTKTIDNVVVTATAAKGVLPEDAEFIVTPIEKESDQYTEVADKLEKKAENEEYSIAGFLAYDIYFKDSEGNKINPEDGKVKVSMDYQNATAPEEVKEADTATMSLDSADSTDENSQNDTNIAEQNFSVSVMHFVEDDNGNVKSVVDMTSDNTANVEINADSEVQKAEFETESFSTFTITWSVNRQNKKLKIYTVDENFKEVSSSSSSQFQTLSNGNNILMSDIAKKIVVDGLQYKYAYIKNGSNRTIVARLSYNTNADGWCYTDYTSPDSNWNNLNNRKDIYNVYLVYSNKTLDTVDTIDSKNSGVDMKIINYNIGGKTNQFTGKTWSSGDDAGRNVKQGILSNTLGEDGYPTFVESTMKDINGKDLSGASLSKYYNNCNLGTLSDANHLFLKSYYDKDGTFFYDSGENGASYQNDGNFSVYKQLVTPNGNDGENFFYQRGNFLPFNTFNTMIAGNYGNLYDSFGNKLSSSNSRYNETLYRTDQSVNYNFGMQLGTTFIQDKDGRYNGKNMRYEFTGDDDLWVYIDGVLVLDMGGCHDARSGWIDFSTGEVYVQNITGGKDTSLTTTLKAAFDKAGKTDVQWKEKDGHYIFQNYSSHTLKMFYMERGQGASNLRIKFNLPTIPDGEVQVKKELSNTDKEKYANVNFAFQIYAQKVTGTDANGNETYSETEYVPLGSENKEDGTQKAEAVYKGTTKPIEFSDGVTFGNKSYDNVFYLKPGETASFKNLKSTRKYYVKEIGVKSEEYDEVVINDQTMTNENGEVIAGSDTVGNRPAITFTNNCSAYNRRELKITKKVNSKEQINDTFSFLVQLSDQNGELVNYTGDYYLLDAEGNYYYYGKDGKLKNNGSGKDKAIVCGKTQDGVIPNVKNGYSIAITQILSGTKFKVTEYKLNTDRYETPVYETAYIGTNGHDNVKAEAVNEGEIKLYYDAAVTVTNTPYSKIKVNKVWENIEGAATETVYVGLYKKNAETKVWEPVADKIAELKKDHYSTVFDKLDSRFEYDVKELRPAEKGENAEFTSEGKKYVKADSSIQIGGSNYKINYSDLTQDENDETQKNITITNKKSNKIVVIKNWTDGSEGHDSVIAGLYKGDKYADQYVRLDNSNSWTGEFAVDVLNGYSVKEMKADDSGNVIIGEQKYSPVSADSIVTIGDKKYKVTYEDKSENQVKTVTITNNRLGTIAITKVDSKNEQKLLEGAEFKLQKKDAENNFVDVQGKTATTGKDGNATFDELEPGTYKIVETKAPKGYALPANGITVDLGIGENKVFDLTQKITNTEIYELPSSGGPGIYGFTISGVAILVTALLLFINNKRREEEAKRS